MKKNLALFGVFLSLLVLTYFFQEKRVEKEHREALDQDRLIKGEITHLKLPSIEAVKKNGQWWAGDKLLSHNTFKQIEKKLSEIYKIKDITGDRATYFPNPFSFEVNHVPWAIGDMSLDKQAFYMANDKNIYLAVIEGESTELTRDPNKIAGIKMNELLAALSKSKAGLLETQLFRFFPDIPMKRVVVEAEGSLPFELDFEKNTTVPPPIKGINVHRDLKSKLHTLITQVTLKEEVPYSDNLKFKKLANISFINDSKKVDWELWIRSATSADAFIIDPAQKRAWMMVGGTLKLYFVHLQDYWDKKVIPQQDFTSFSTLNAKFIQGDKEANVTIVNKEPLEFQVKGLKVDQAKMEQLMQFIFNLGARDQAERVSPLTKSDKQQLLSENHLRIEVMGQELILWRKTEELIVANLTQGYKVHFALTDKNFIGTFQDMLK